MEQIIRDSNGRFVKGCKIKLGSHFSQETKQIMREKKLGITLSEEHKRKIGESMKGRNITWNLKMSESQRGEKSHNWKGGRIRLKELIRKTFKYREWVARCLTRDLFRCQYCGTNTNKLNVHHIKPFSVMIEQNKITSVDEALACKELWNIKNGLTLCKKHHREIHKQKSEEKQNGTESHIRI